MKTFWWKGDAVPCVRGTPCPVSGGERPENADSHQFAREAGEGEGGLLGWEECISSPPPLPIL